MFESPSFINHFPYLGIFLLLILGGIGLPFPEDTTLLLSGFLMAHHIIKPLPAFLVVYFGLLITDFSLYLVGKKYGRRIVEHKRFRKMISPNRLSKLEDSFKKWGSLVVFFGRHIFVLRAQIFLVSGVMKMSATKFLVADAISALFTIGLWGGVGYLGGNSVQVLKKDITRVEHITIIVFVILISSGIIFWYLRSIKKFRKT
ncbi:MAG: DedA family protein [Syntrophaceae bacterium]|nr:DedA family protein [Syntrophaceae bacterium]